MGITWIDIIYKKNLKNPYQPSLCYDRLADDMQVIIFYECLDLKNLLPNAIQKHARKNKYLQTLETFCPIAEIEPTQMDILSLSNQNYKRTRLLIEFKHLPICRYTFQACSQHFANQSSSNLPVLRQRDKGSC